MYKKRVEGAIARYMAKQEVKSAGPTRQNESPEADFVHEKLIPFCREAGIKIFKYESKAMFSESMGAYIKGVVPVGHSDLAGRFTNGVAVYLEAKAPGRRSRLKPHQREFLVDAIRDNCFAACVDNISDLKDLILRYNRAENKVALLLSALPPETEANHDSGKLFDDD
jgi:hypothetical protein